MENQEKRRSRATLVEVAELALVSKSTVSRVVNEDAAVSEETRERVMDAIRTTGYRVNQSARALVSNKTGAIAVAIYEQLATYFTSSFSGAMVTALQDFFFEKDLQVLILPAPNRERQQRIEKYIYEGHVDGAILLGPIREDILLPDLLGAHVPIVVGGRPIGSDSVSYVDIDNAKASELVVRALVKDGRKSIGFITGQLSNASATDRLRGYKLGLEGSTANDAETLIGIADWGYESAASATAKILKSHPEMDAIFCSNDLMATAALAVIRDAGRSVPSDIAVVGFDNSPIALRTNPQLTSVAQSPEDYARALGENLLKQMSGQDLRPKPVILPTEIVWRESFNPENTK